MARATTGASVLALSLCLTTGTHAQQELVEKVTDPSQPAVVPNESPPADTKPREFFGVDPTTGERSRIRFLETGGPRVLDPCDDGKLEAGGKNVSPLSGTVRAFVGLDPNTGKTSRIQFLEEGKPTFIDTRAVGEFEIGGPKVHSPLSGTVRAFISLDPNTGEVTRIRYLETGTSVQFKTPGNQSKSPVDTLEQFRRFQSEGISSKQSPAGKEKSNSAVPEDLGTPDHGGAPLRTSSQAGWYNADGTLDEDQIKDAGDRFQPNGFFWFNADGTRYDPNGVGVKTPGGFSAQRAAIGLDDPLDGSGISPAPTERKILGPVSPDSLRPPITTKDADRKSAAEPESP